MSNHSAALEMNSEKSAWNKGYGVVHHNAETIARVEEMVAYLSAQCMAGDGVSPFALLAAADRLTNAVMWLVVHQTYAQTVYPDGRDMQSQDFKPDPQGHLGGSLNMVPAYVGYLLANALTGKTRGWVMEQGHAVAAIDSANLLVGNMTARHAERYSLSAEGLSRFAQDFYAYRLNESGKPDSPLGSHVNPHTAGGHMEGGYLGFASLQYAHMPLVGESLLAFLSDGAFEEQRGSDWTPRWWRAEDSGLICPIMIANGRRIDQRSTLEQEGGAEWFRKYLRLHGFDPLVFDGRDPAAFAWCIIEQERRLQANVAALDSITCYDVAIPYGVAVAPKGAGFFNEGTNHAHNLPLMTNPHHDAVAAQRFNSHAKKLFVPMDELKDSIARFSQHVSSGRVQEKDHPMANRQVTVKLPKRLEPKDPPVCPADSANWKYVSPMDAVDAAYLATVQANPSLRPRVGNPDEILSNRMDNTLQALKLRVIEPEEGAAESTLGNIITALNEEAISAAAFGNKGGLNIIVTYEAFAAKMFGAARQEVIFSKHCHDVGREMGWASVPIVLTSNTWENSKNELSHQDPSFAESMFSESSDTSRVVFPADYNSTAAVMRHLYGTQGQLWSLVVPKQKTPCFFTVEESERLVGDGGIHVEWAGFEPDTALLAFVAIGAYQLMEVLRASARLKEKQVPHRVVYLLEPARFRTPRNEGELAHQASPAQQTSLLSAQIQEIVLASHTRVELIIGALQPLWNRRAVTGHGFINQGGTLGIDDMLYVNRVSWAHLLQSAARTLGLDEQTILTTEEVQALHGQRSPDGVITKLK